MRRNYDKILVTIYNPRVEVSLSEDRVLKSKSMYCSMLNVSTCVTAMFPCLLAIESDLRLNILRGLIVKMLELLRPGPPPATRLHTSNTVLVSTLTTNTFKQICDDQDGDKICEQI